MQQVVGKLRNGVQQQKNKHHDKEPALRFVRPLLNKGVDDAGERYHKRRHMERRSDVVRKIHNNSRGFAPVR